MIINRIATVVVSATLALPVALAAQAAAPAGAQAAADAATQTAVQTGSPAQVYRAFQAQRQVLADQLASAQRLRERLVAQMAEPTQTPATKASLEKRIANADARIADLDQQIAKSDLAVAQAAAVPGATVRPPDPPRSGPPEEAFVLGGILMVIFAVPMSLAFARRIWRRSARATVTLPPEVAERMEHLERGVEAIALEVERIGEGQRFLTHALTQRGEPVPVRALGVGAAEPVPARARERAEERR